jgi:hypothetical protein
MPVMVLSSHVGRDAMSLANHTHDGAADDHANVTSGEIYI